MDGLDHSYHGVPFICMYDRTPYPGKSGIFRTGWITPYPCVPDIYKDDRTDWITPYPGISDICLDGRTGWITPYPVESGICMDGRTGWIT